MGEFSNLLVESKSDLICTYISSESLMVLKKIYSKTKRVTCDVVDIETLPYKTGAFDFVFIAGGISYGDNKTVLKEIYRVLKVEGQFIAVDSLNHNPIYRFNRWAHFLKGHRSKSTLKIIPNIKLINNYINMFGEGKVFYFGAFSFLFYIVSFFSNSNKTKIVFDWLDYLFRVKNLLFKFVLVVKKNE